MDFHFLAALFWEKSVRWTVFGGRQVHGKDMKIGLLTAILKRTGIQK